MSARRKAIIALIIAHLIWGASTPILKLSLTTIPPFTLAVLRNFFTSMILLLFLSIKREQIVLDRQDVLPVLFWALCVVPVNIGLFFLGLKLSTAIDTAVISSTVPLFTALAAWLFFKEKIARTNLLGIIIAFLGTMVIIGTPLFSFGLGDGPRTLGNLLNLFASVAWVAGTLVYKRFAQKYQPTMMTAIAFLVGFICLLPFAMLEIRNHPLWFDAVALPAYFGLFYAVVGNSIIAYSLFNYAFASVSATEANTVSYIMPVIAAVIAIPLLGEVITLPFILGSSIIALGVFLAETRHRWHPLHRHVHRQSS